MEIRALIVDDEEQTIRVLKDKVRWAMLGITEVFGANSAHAAREILDKQKIPLILCDIEMPGESGLEFIQWLREQSDLNGKYTECIILTCYPEYSYMRKAMQLGCCDYLIKPADTEEVEAVIRKAVAGIREDEAFQKKTDAFPMKKNEDTGGENGIIEKKVLPYIKNHYTEMLTVNDIASDAALNPQYLMRLFRKKTGMSVLEYVTELRLEQARYLLSTTDWTNEIISEKIGYASSNYFIKLFKTQFGITPREFRKNIKTSAEG